MSSAAKAKVASKDADFLLREVEAQKKRALALAHLGKTGCGPSAHQNCIAKVGLVAALGQKEKHKSTNRDNTLSILQKRKAEESSNINAHFTAKKNVAENSTKQCSNNGDSPYLECDVILLPNWNAIKDSNSGKTYYWNKITNETTWDVPKQLSSHKEETEVASLPAGWKEELHPATKQKYYVHEASGNKSYAFPKSN